MRNRRAEQASKNVAARKKIVGGGFQYHTLASADIERSAKNSPSVI
jgi:hypothetical protein